MSTELEEPPITAADAAEPADEVRPDQASEADSGLESASESPELDDAEPDVDEDELGDDEPDPNAGDEEQRREGQTAEANIEQAFRKLELEAARHSKRVVEIMADDIDQLLPCALCHPAIPGFRFDVPIQGEQLSAVKAAIGLETTEHLDRDYASRECDKCHGFGRVTSGSKVPGFEVVKCVACHGKGWIAVGAERQEEAAATPFIATGGDETAPLVPVDENDIWGTPRGDPEWGMAPQYRTRPVPGVV